MESIRHLIGCYPEQTPPGLYNLLKIDKNHTIGRCQFQDGYHQNLVSLEFGGHQNQ